MRFIIPCIALLFVGCAAPRGLHVRSDYLTPDYLASTRIDTPEGCYGCFFGEQIVVRWGVSKSCLINQYPILQLTIRYGDRSLEVVRASIPKTHGFWTHQVLNDAYFDRGGILSYKVQILSSTGVVISEWRHHIWAEIINSCEENS